jgi:hypothetical protein
MITTSPGFTSRIHSAPTTSKAQVSDETTIAPLAILPIERGRKPFGSKAAEIDESKVPVLPIFKALEKYGEIKHEEMFEIFNMGIGLMFAVKPENVERVKELLDEPVYEIGRIVKKDGASVDYFTGKYSTPLYDYEKSYLESLEEHTSFY